jgi:uncharacterized membrane protein YccC
VPAALVWLRQRIRARKAALRFCLRLTAAALLAFALMQFWTLPLRGLWAVITAVVVMQTSIGGSLRATTEYVIGTSVGALYASLVGVLVPHSTVLEAMGVLALAVAPLAYLAALSPSFRVAPFTAIIVLLLSGQFGESPVASAFTRLGEVVLGGAVALLVSLIILPDRAHGLGLDAARRALYQLADAFSVLIAGLTKPLAGDAIRDLQDEMGRAVAAFQGMVDETQREQLIGLAPRPDPGRLSRILLRLRHDLVIIGRAAALPLPESMARRLEAPLTAIAATGRDELRAAADALAARKAPPDTARFEASIDSFVAELAALRREGLTIPLSTSEAEQLFALSFALEQLRQNFRDLARAIGEWAKR